MQEISGTSLVQPHWFLTRLNTEQKELRAKIHRETNQRNRGQMSNELETMTTDEWLGINQTMTMKTKTR